MFSVSFSMYYITRGACRNRASVYICRCGVVEYRANEYAFVTGALRAVISDS